MAAPSKSWVVIADGQVDADSPLDTTLMTAVRDDLVHLEEWLGMSYTAAQDHDHDGTNSKSTLSAQINLGSYPPTTIGTSSSTYITANTMNIYVPGGAASLEYYMYLDPQGQQAHAYLNIGGTNGGVLSKTTAGAGWVGPATIAVTSFSGWQTVNIRLKRGGTTTTVYFEKCMVRII